MSDDGPQRLGKVLDGMERWVRQMPDQLPPPITLVCAACGRLFHGREGDRCPHCLRTATTSRAERLLRAGVPSAFAEELFQEPAAWPRDPAAPEVDPAAWTGRPWSILFHGQVGSGKTMLAVELLARALARGAGGLFVRSSALPRLLYGPNGDTAFEELAAAPVLVVDDLGRGVSGRGLDAVSEIGAQRHSEGSPTLWTSNLDLLELAKHGDGALADRLGEGLVVKVPGGSRRRGGRRVE